MYQNQEYCQLHTQNIITHICLIKHDCQRRLCPKCEYDHQKFVPHGKILPLEVFQKRKLDEIAKYNLEDQNQVNMAEANNKSLLSDIEANLMDLLNDIKICQQRILDDLREQDQYYLKLLKQEPQESSQNDLNIMINLLQEEFLENWTKNKKKILQLCQNRLDLLHNSFLKLITIFKDQIRNPTPTKFYSCIQQGPKYFGIKHGKFQYILDGIIENAGEFKFGQKVNLWNQFGLEVNKGKLDKVIFQIDYNQNKGYETYIKDHQILNKKSLKSNQTDAQILYNLESIKQQKNDQDKCIFEEESNNFQQNEKHTELTANIWNNQITFTGLKRQEKHFDRWNIIYCDQIIGGGVYDENGNKNGNWIDIHNNFYKNCQVTYDGEYKNGKRQRNFDIMLRVDQNEPFHKIGGGYYDINGIKQGRWMELNDHFCLDGQVIFEGEYKEGKQIGKWIQTYRERDEYRFIQIGGGEFNINGIKQGVWVELDKTFQKNRQIIYKGEYGSGKKFSQWDILYRQEQSSLFSNIGGGFYNEQELRHGNWIELWKNFQKDSQIIYKGEYQNGLRFGEWKIMFRVDEKYEFKQIGQGMFDQNCSKVGNWTEVSNNFTIQEQIIINGEYRDGKKYGEWNILVRFDSHSNFKNIGGGSFDENELKNGIWKELNPNFSKDCQILEIGEYQNGVKRGRWNIQIKSSETQELLFEGGGNYDQVGMKTDRWNDIDEQFTLINQFIYSGVYKIGKKINKWEINYLDGNKLIKYGEGSYNQLNLKDGQWIDVKETFKNDEIYCLISMQGVYKDGKKIGIWKTYNIYKGQNQSLIGEGCYDENGTKIGKWVEVDDEFQKNKQIIYEGIYKNGRRFSQWKTFYLNSQFERIKIGSGIYDDDGLKNGNWIDLHKNFIQNYQIIQEGSYRQGNKVGKWDIKYRENDKMKYQIIGGGQYYQKGVKIGQWIELHKNFQKNCQVKYQGQYQNGIKIGDWTIYYSDQHKSNNEPYIKIGGGSYNEIGQKNGDWVDLHENFHSERYVIYKIVYQEGVIVKQQIMNQ